MKERIVIVGAGPVGCYLAQQLKGYGLEPLLIEEHEQVGRPVHCTGIIGSRLFNEMKAFPAAHPSVINKINGATIHFNGDSFDIERECAAYVVERDKFDQELSRSLDIVYGNRFLGFEKAKSGYVIETDKNEFETDIIIAADGGDSSVRKALTRNLNTGFKSSKGFQLRMKYRAKRHDFVEVYIQKPSFFWIVPEGKEVVRVGVISDNPYVDLQEFIKKNNIQGEVIDKYGGLVTIGICPETVKDNIVLVGGAACQVKPLTYGGIYFGLKSAQILALCIKDGRLNDYDRLWKSELGFEIKTGLKLKEVYERLEHKELERVFNFLKSQKATIEKFADFENHSRFFVEIIRNPSIYSKLGDLFSIFLKAII